ncbi:hypothetical protein [Gordonia aichiensis]|uniref:hypothetical protein n=1 Tax=Gordonia aichiensis TaxID=36820 RepID=UPI003263712D
MVLAVATKTPATANGVTVHQSTPSPDHLMAAAGTAATTATVWMTASATYARQQVVDFWSA